MGPRELIEITNRLRHRSFQAGDFVVERWYGCRSIRARQPGTHARPAAGGVSGQVRPMIVAIRRQRAASLTDREGARLVARHDVLRGGAPARGAACFLVRWPAPGPRIPGGPGICPAAGPPGLDLTAESWHHIRRLATHRGSLPPRGARAIGSRGTDLPVRPGGACHRASAAAEREAPGRPSATMTPIRNVSLGPWPGFGPAQRDNGRGLPLSRAGSGPHDGEGHDGRQRKAGTRRQ